LRELTNISVLELDTLSLWWEEIPLTVEFCLHLPDSHLRLHTIQLETTLETLTGPPTEVKRLLRLISAPLADVDNMIIGDWLLGKRRRQETAAVITQRAGEIDKIITG